MSKEGALARIEKYKTSNPVNEKMVKEAEEFYKNYDKLKAISDAPKDKVDPIDQIVKSKK